MIPTIGRIVHFHPIVAREEPDPDASPLPLITYAAIVTDVRGTSEAPEVHLQIFPPGCESWHCSYATYSEEPTAGCWNWPPRV